jgi:hypothetical protein
MSKIPHLQHKDRKKIPKEMSFSPKWVFSPKSGNTDHVVDMIHINISKFLRNNTPAYIFV